MYKYGIVKALPKDVEETREVPFIISSETKDRAGHRLLLNRWDLTNYQENGVVGYQHNVWGGDMCNAPDPDYMMGPGKAWIEGDYLLGMVKFEPESVNPLAEKIFQKVLHGTLKSASVGLLETNEDESFVDEKDGAYVLGGQELVEWSIVNIPANPDAIRKHFSSSTFDQALNYLDKVLGDKYSLEELKEMKVAHVLEAMKGNFYKPEEEKEVKQILIEQDKNPAYRLNKLNEKMARSYSL
jgi:hypothetical protein